MSTKFNFNKYTEYLKEKESENKAMENKKDVKNDVKPDDSITKEDLKNENNILEKRIYGMLKPLFKKIQYIDKNTQYLKMDKQITGAIKDLKKKGYTFDNEDEMQEQIEVNYLQGLGFKFEKKEAKENGTK